MHFLHTKHSHSAPGKHRLLFYFFFSSYCSSNFLLFYKITALFSAGVVMAFGGELRFLHKSRFGSAYTFTMILIVVFSLGFGQEHAVKILRTGDIYR